MSTHFVFSARAVAHTGRQRTAAPIITAFVVCAVILRLAGRWHNALEVEAFGIITTIRVFFTFFNAGTIYAFTTAEAVYTHAAAVQAAAITAGLDL